MTAPCTRTNTGAIIAGSFAVVGMAFHAALVRTADVAQQEAGRCLAQNATNCSSLQAYAASITSANSYVGLSIGLLTLCTWAGTVLFLKRSIKPL